MNQFNQGQWQPLVQQVLEGASVDPLLVNLIDDVLVFLAKFDSDNTEFAAQCMTICGGELEAKKAILGIIESLILSDKHDLIRIFGRSAFNDSSQKKLKRRYQRLRRVFHPDLGMAEPQWLTERMSVINKAYELAQEHYDDPSVVETKGTSSFKTYSANTDDRHQQGAKSQRKRRAKPKQTISFNLEENIFSSLFSGTFNQFRALLVRLVYRAQRQAIDNKISGVVKVTVAFLAVLLLLNVLIQVFLPAPGLVIIKSNEIGGRTEEAELPPSEEEIDDLLDRLLKENSTSGLVDMAVNKKTLHIPRDDNEYLSFTWDEQKSLKQSDELNKSSNQIGVSTEKVNDDVLKQKNIEKGRLDILGDDLQRFFLSLEGSYKLRSITEFAAHFSKEGRYFDEVGRQAIVSFESESSVKYDELVIEFHISKLQVAGPWVYIKAQLYSQFSQLDQNVLKGECGEVGIIVLSQTGMYQITSMKKENEVTGPSEFCTLMLSN